MFEQQQGRSHALNAGIAATSGDLVGIIDDDEEIDPSWYKTAVAALADGSLDFIGGPYVPRWSQALPEWPPREYGGVVGWVDGGDKAVPFDRSYPGILMGGNVVLRGLCSNALDHTRRGWAALIKVLLTGEDEELYGRLLAQGAKGMYLPNLIIYHHVPAERLTKSYFRRWCFWRGVSLGLLDRTRKLPCAYLSEFRDGTIETRCECSRRRSIVVKPKDQAHAFAAELGIWDWLGLLYGRHFRKADANPTQSSLGVQVDG